MNNTKCSLIINADRDPVVEEVDVFRACQSNDKRDIIFCKRDEFLLYSRNTQVT
jgi:hypothetical protein